MTESLFMDDFPADLLLKETEVTAWPMMQDHIWWSAATNALKLYEPPPAGLKLSHAERKWELVSAYQKTVRRGDTDLALKLVSAMCSLPAELPYFWRRVCTTATEDVGAGDIQVMNFVVACSAIFLPKKAAQYQYKVLCFLTEMMCATTRSRAYCMMSILEGMFKAGVHPELTSRENGICAAIKGVQDKEGWAKKNNWRGETMLVFQLADYQLNMDVSPWKRPVAPLLKGLPNYCYDMHTRVGKSVCAILTAFAPMKEFFAQTPTIQSKSEAVGWAMLFEEGLLIDSELVDRDLEFMEQKFIAAKFGWTFDRWMDFRQIFKDLLDEGAVDKLRIKMLGEQGY